MEGGNIIQHSSYSIHNASGPEENWIACCSESSGDPTEFLFMFYVSTFKYVFL